jgi:hypothetical protein
MIDDVDVDSAASCFRDQPLDRRTGKDLEGLDRDTRIFLRELGCNLLVQAHIERRPQDHLAFFPGGLVKRRSRVGGACRVGGEQHCDRGRDAKHA